MSVEEAVDHYGLRLEEREAWEAAFNALDKL